VNFDDMKDDDPWFQQEPTRALGVWLKRQKDSAHETVVAKVRDNDAPAAREYVGQHDAFKKVLIMIQEGKQ
jgi:hypothetical protein